MINSILRQACRGPSDKLNIFCMPTHERYETGVARTGHNFYAFMTNGVKDWKSIYAPRPKNYHLLRFYDKPFNIHNAAHFLPKGVDFDCVLSQNKFGQYQIARAFSHYLHVPLISLEHTLPTNKWMVDRIHQWKSMSGHLNLFISEYSREKWGWKDGEAEIIHHGVDTDLFTVRDGVYNRENVVLSVCNDWINRDEPCGFKLWQGIAQGLPTKVLGDTPGLSKPAATTEELAATYASSKVFLNTSLISPVPTSLLEAMACGCACVSTDNCMISDIIINGVNGFISNNPKELQDYCNLLLKNSKLADELGRAARQTILDNFSMKVFVENWNNIFSRACSIPYRGEFA